VSNIPAFWFIAFEAAKLLLQFAGALFIARRTVDWALGRYKSEKTWERRLGAYVDAVSSVAEMERLVGTWLERAYRRGDVSEEFRDIEGAEYRAARRKLDEGTSAARLLLHGTTSKILSELEDELQSARDATMWEEHLDMELGALRKAKNSLIANGQRVLELPKDT